MNYTRPKKKKRKKSVVDKYRKRTGKAEDDFPEAFSPRLHGAVDQMQHGDK